MKNASLLRLKHAKNVDSNNEMFIKVFNARLHWEKHRFYCCFVLPVCQKHVRMVEHQILNKVDAVSFTAKQSDVLHIVCVQWKPCISKLDDWLFKKNGLDYLQNVQ